MCQDEDLDVRIPVISGILKIVKSLPEKALDAFELASSTYRDSNKHVQLSTVSTISKIVESHPRNGFQCFRTLFNIVSRRR